MKCSQKRSCSAQLQLSSCSDTRPPHIPHYTDICHTPGSSHIGGTVARRQWHAFSWPKSTRAAKCKRPCFAAAPLQDFHSTRKEIHTRGEVEREPPLSPNESWQGECRASLHWLANDRWSPGAIRQTNDGFIRTCHWQVMNAALSEPYLEQDKNWEKRCEMLCRLFRRRLCFSFQVCAFKPY